MKRRLPFGVSQGTNFDISPPLPKTLVDTTSGESGAVAAELSVREVIQAYLEDRGARVKNQRELAWRVTSLLSYWGDRKVSEINKRTCLEYARIRNATTARRQFEDLRSAVNLAIEDGKIHHRIIIKLPPKVPSRHRFLTRNQVAALVWKAYRRRKSYTYGRRSAPQDRGKVVKCMFKPSVHVARFILVGTYTGNRSARIFRASFEKEAGRPWIDLQNGLYYRTWQDELVASNKRAATIRIPQRLLAHMKRWERSGGRYLIEVGGKPVNPQQAFRKLVREVLAEDGAGVCRHTLRHTAATWLMQSGVNINEIAGFLSMSVQMLESVYAHHHPDHQKGVDVAFTKGQAGRAL